VTPADFKTIRESLGISAQWLATAVHVDQRTVRRWEDGAIPLRADVVDLLTRLDEQMAADVGTEVDQVLAYLDAIPGTELAALLDSLSPDDCPVLEIPRVDTDVTDVRGLPASYHRAVAARVRQRLGGRLRLMYVVGETTH
jgi:DNA-binding XRE family transcriptional regulator